LHLSSQNNNLFLSKTKIINMRFKTLLIICLVALWSCTQAPQEDQAAHSHEGDAAHVHEDGSTHAHSDETPEGQTAIAALDTLPSTVVPATDVSPEYIQMARGIEIITDIKEAVGSAGVMTHEGIFGPLLFAEDIRSFFIELQPGMFLSEHPHPTESIVYTVSGKWVLCSEGKRQVMETGSVFHFGSNIPTGWEAPFDEKALLLVVKSSKPEEAYAPYVKGLQDMAASLDKDRESGGVYYFNGLEEEHAAIKFARSVNPDFDKVLSIKY
jgi:quercetin dioxygenase-like cupin family protein